MLVEGWHQKWKTCINEEGARGPLSDQLAETSKKLSTHLDQNDFRSNVFSTGDSMDPEEDPTVEKNDSERESLLASGLVSSISSGGVVRLARDTVFGRGRYMNIFILIVHLSVTYSALYIQKGLSQMGGIQNS
jgi:hypothetical protein